MPNALKNAELIKQFALQVGFAFCGISKADFLEEEAPKLENWLLKGYHGQMKYMENHFDMRLDPRKLVPGAKTVVSLMYNYYPPKAIEMPFKLAKYAYGEDYHKVVKDKCKELIFLIEENIGKVEGRAFTDSAPIMERAWAQKSGIGWIGKHGLAINKTQGSFFFLAELIIDLECSPDQAIKDYCGTCTACIDACPTAAILPNKTLNASQCISYLTIELKEEIPTEFKGKMNDWIFGCDICQEVCPWNRFSKAHHEPRFNLNPTIENLSPMDWQEITESVFNNLFSKSAIKRTKMEGLKRNISFIDNL
jgi:epoxyqueuosine reductase